MKSQTVHCEAQVYLKTREAMGDTIITRNKNKLNIR